MNIGEDDHDGMKIDKLVVTKLCHPLLRVGQNPKICHSFVAVVQDRHWNPVWHAAASSLWCQTIQEIPCITASTEGSVVEL